MASRRSSRELGHESVQAFLDAVKALPGVRAVTAPGDSGDAVVELHDGRRLAVELKGAAHADPTRVAGSLSEWTRSLRRRRGADAVGVVVANSVPERSKRMLAEAGWGWLDRRGHLFLQGPGVLIDTTVAARPHGRNRGDPLTTGAGLAVAASLLLTPEERATVRPLARRLALAPSTVSQTLSALRDNALLRSDGLPLVPELFWAVADAWPRRAISVARLPSEEGALRLCFDRLDRPGWAVGGVVAASLLGAPAPLLAEEPPDFYVPDETEQRAAVRALGEASVWEQRAATVAVGPVSLMTAERLAPPTPSYPVVHPVFAALDLAQDKARGAEILEDWRPPAPYTRVW